MYSAAVDQSMARPMTTATTTPMMAMTVYCRFRYADAPSWMAAAISCMRALPGG